jgi:hypothetical protein
MSLASEIHLAVLDRRALAISRPIGHQAPALLHHVAAPIGRLDLVADRVRERDLGKLVSAPRTNP